MKNEIELHEIAKVVARGLCYMPSESKRFTAPDTCHLIYPKKRGSSGDRISEQEARMLYCIHLANRNIPFAVEVPTEGIYSFKGKNYRSASTDLLIYEPGADKFSRKIGIEFKAHNPCANNIQKDLQKLLQESCKGMWFHVLNNIDSGTLPSLFKKFEQQLARLFEKNEVGVACDHSISLYVTVIKHGLLLYRTFEPPVTVVPNLDFKYHIVHNKIVVQEKGGWNYESFSRDLRS